MAFGISRALPSIGNKWLRILAWELISNTTPVFFFSSTIMSTPAFANPGIAFVAFKAISLISSVKSDVTSIGSPPDETRSEDHTSELQSRGHIVCRLLLEKNNIRVNHHKSDKMY